MLNTVLFGTYCGSMAALAYHTAKINEIDHFDRDVKEYREYDFENEKVKKPDHSKEIKAIVLAQYNDSASTEDRVLFQRKIAFFNALDPTKLFKSKIQKAEQFSLLFNQSAKNQDTPFEVQFESGSKTQFFDLETLETDLNVKQGITFLDRIKALYWRGVWKQDMGYLTKGIKVNGETGKAPELMFVGNLKFDTTQNRFIMRRPDLVIGSDRLELYEFLARRKEVLSGHNKQLIKLMIAITIAHALIV